MFKLSELALEGLMTRTLFTLVVILAALLCPAHAQDTPTTDKPQTKDAALREKAFDLLESAAGQLNTLQSPENRARLGANIADSLWDHDEKRARALFALAQEDIKAGLHREVGDDPNELHTLRVFMKLRVDTVERIAKYDAELALAFLSATEPTSNKELMQELNKKERGLEMRLASKMANNNPDLAVKLARQSLDQGLSKDLIVLLKRVDKKDKAQALVLYKDIIKKLRDADLEDDWNLRNFAARLTYSFKPSDNSAFRELIGVLITKALAHGCSQNLTEDHRTQFCSWVASILPQLEKLDPRAVQLKRWIPDDRVVNLSPDAVHELEDLLEQGNLNNLLAFAARHPDIADDVYWHAVRTAILAFDFEVARKLVTDHIADPARKEVLLDEIKRKQEWLSFDDKKLVELQSQLNEIRTTPERVRFLLEHAKQFSGTNRNAVLKVLKQASEMADTMKPGNERTDVQLKVALQYCLEKNELGFVIMESLLPKLNELVDAAVKLDGYETGYVRDGEWNMSANGNVGQLLTTLSQNAGNFAWCDFDRAVSLAAQFDRSEIRLMAQVKLAQAILAGPPKPGRMKYESFH